MIAAVKNKESLFRSLLQHPKIKKINSAGLMIAVEFEDFKTNKRIIDTLIEQGIFTDWFLFAPNCLRISPPLNIPDTDINTACEKIIAVLNSF